MNYKSVTSARINKDGIKMSEYKELADTKNKKSPEIEYIASRLSSVMDTYKKLIANKCVQ